MAQSSGTVLANASVYEQPNPKSEVLVDLTKGKTVSVFEQRGGWVKVKVQLDKAFSFTGWMSAKKVQWKGSVQAARPVPTAVPRTAQQMRPAPAPTAVPRSDLDQFFAPAGSAPPPTSATEFPSEASVRSTSNPSTKSSVFSNDPRAAEFAFHDKARVNASLGYLLYHYKLSNTGAAAASLFSYNLPGLGVTVSSDYWFSEKMDGKLRIGGSLGLQYGLYRFSTKLADSEGIAFNTVSSSASSLDAILKMPMEYRFGKDSYVVGGNIGVEYLKFMANDVRSDAGPINLYVSQTTMTALAGVYGKVPFHLYTPLMVSAGVDALVFSFVSESPGDQTGTSPKGKIGFAPSLVFTWTPWENHHMDLGYRMRYQKFSFSGVGSRVGTSNVSGGTVESAIHETFVGYNYYFQ
jgi:hypothetical protein